MDKVRDWLTNLGLCEYGDIFYDNGWDDMETICSMSETDIKIIVPKLGHVRKLSLAIERLKSERSFTCDANIDRTFSSVNVSTGTNICAPKDINEEAKQEIKQEDMLESHTSNAEKTPAEQTERHTVDYREQSIHLSTPSNTPDTHKLCAEAREDRDFDQPICIDNVPGLKEDTGYDDTSSDDESRGARHALVHLPSSNATVAGRTPTIGQLIAMSTATSVTHAPIVKDSKNVTIAEKVEVHNIQQHGQASYDNYKDQIHTVVSGYERKSHLFVKTKAYNEVVDVLEDRNWAVISGNPGDGKSTMALHLMLEHSQRQYTPLVVNSVEDWKAMVVGKGKHADKQIIMIDDMFGSLGVDERKLNDWMSLLGLIGKLVEERNGDLKVVCTTRKYVLTQVSTRLSGYKEFGKLYIVDLAETAHSVLPKEKEEMLIKYFKYYKIDFNRQMILTIIDLKSTYGFPHCVEMYCSSSVLRDKGLRFFETPIKLLEREIQYLFESKKETYCALIIVLLSKENEVCMDSLEHATVNITVTNALKLSRMPLNTFLPAIADALNMLDGVFIEEKQEGVFGFKHDSFKEILSIVCVKSSPAFAIELLDFQILSEITKCFGYKPAMHEDIVVLSKSSTNTLVMRITQIMYDEKLAKNSSTFLCDQMRFACGYRLWEDDCFIDHWLKYVTASKSNEKVNLCFLVELMKGVYDRKNDIMKPGLLSLLSKAKREKAICMILQETQIQYFLQSKDGVYELSAALVHASIADCSAKLLQELVIYGADVNTEYKFEGISISFVNVAKFGGLPVFHQMLYNGFCTPLFCSVGKDNAENTKTLLDNGASTFKQGPGIKGLSLLYWAAIYGSQDVLSCILKHIHSLDIRNRTDLKGEYQHQQHLHGENYVRYFCCMKSLDLVFVYGGSQDTYYCYVCPVHVAEKVDVLQMLNEECAKVNEPIISKYVPIRPVYMPEGFNDFTIITLSNLIYRFLGDRLNPAIIDALVMRGADVNTRYRKDRSILHVEGIDAKDETQRLGVLPCLLKHGIDLNAQDSDGKTPLSFLLSTRWHEDDVTVDWLLTSGADVNIPDKLGCIPLMYALRSIYTGSKMLKRMIRSTNFASAVDKTGKNCYHFLAENVELYSEAAIKTIIQLREQNIDINHLDNNGQLPVAFAGKQMMKLFLANGANPNMLDSRGRTIVMQLIVNETNDIVEKTQMLIKSGIDYSIKDQLKHRNITHYIVQSSYDEDIKQELLDMFLNNKGHINVTDKNGVTPIMLAVGNAKCSQEFICYLIDKGATITDIDTSGLSVLHHCFRSSIDESEKYKICVKLISIAGLSQIGRDTLMFALAALTGMKIENLILNHVHLDDITVAESFSTVLNSKRDDSSKVNLFKTMLEKCRSFLSLKDTLETDKTWHALILKSPLCLELVLRAGLINIALLSEGTDTNYLPKSDRETSKTLHILATHGIDINTSLQGCPEIIFAKKGKLLTLVTLFKHNTCKRLAQIDIEGNTILHWLVLSRKDDSDIAKVLETVYQNLTNCDVPNKRGLTPLHIACQQAELKPQCIGTLIKHSTHINTIDSDGMSALHHLVTHIWVIDDFKEEEVNAVLVCIILDMLSRNGQITIQDKYGKTPLMYLLSNAFANKMSLVAELLVLNTSDTTSVDTERNTILHYLAGSYIDDDLKASFVEALKQKGAQIDALNMNGHTPLHFCQGMFTLKTCRALVCSVRDNCAIWPHLFTVIQWFDDFHDKPECLMNFITSSNIDANTAKDSDGITLISACCRFYRDTKFVEVLLKHGADPDIADCFGYTSIHRLLFSKRLLELSFHKLFCFDTSSIASEIVFQLGHSFPWDLPDMSFYETSPETLKTEVTQQIHARVLHGVNTALKILHLLLVHKADPNKMDIEGKSPLHYCAESPVMDGFTCPAMEMLIAYGADVNIEDYKGRTPLMFCARFERTKFRRMNILIKAGANVMAQDYHGNGVTDYVRTGIRKRVLSDEMKSTEGYDDLQQRFGEYSSCYN